jgi:hypothetical protein
MAIPLIALIGFADDNKVLAIFPFMGAVMGGIIYEYLATDGQVIVGGVNYTDYPLILVPLFLTFGDFALCAYKASPTSRVLESSVLVLILAGIDAYFVPALISSYATASNPNLPAAMLPFVQNYGEVFTIGVSVIMLIYGMYSIWT